MKQRVATLFATERSKAIFLLILTAILWSTGGLLIKMVSWHPMAIACVYNAFSTLVLLAYVRRPRFTWSASQIGAAFSYACLMILFIISNKLTTAANAILLQYTAPVFVAIFSFWMLGERITKADWLTIGVVLGGMVLFFLDDLTPGDLVGNLLSILSGVCFAFFTLLLRKQKDGSRVESIILGNIITILVGLPFCFQSCPSASVSEWAILVIMGVFQVALPDIFYTVAIKTVTALEAILIPVIEPILNPIWVFLLLGEAPGPWALVGGVITLAAVTALSVFKSRVSPNKTYDSGTKAANITK